jgi:putative glutamine amidotransferase
MTAYLQDFDIQGVIMTGGNDLREAPEPTNLAPERDNLETLLLDACATQNIPVLGICRGLQKIVVRYGGTLKHVDGHVGTSHPIEVKPEAPAAFQTREQVNSFHGFGVHVDDLGKELRPAVIAPDGTVEALFHVRHRQWGIMWHPEREPKDPRDQQILRLLIDGE